MIHKLHHGILTAGLILISLSPLQSQSKLDLSLEGAVQYAVENNKTLQNASLSVRESQAAMRSTIAQGLPQLDAKIDYQNFFNSEANIGPMSFTFNPTSNLNFAFGQLLFSGSYIVGIQMSMLYREMSEVNLRKTDAEIRSQAMKSYFLVLVSQRSREILLQNEQNLDDVLAKTTALVSVGILDATSKDQIALQKLMIENAIKSSDRQLEMALNLLRLQLGVGATTEIVLTENLMEIMAKAGLEKSESTSFDIKQNNDFQLMMLQRELAQKKVNMEKSKFLPNIAGFYSYTEKLKKPELDFSPKHVIGFNISIPLFSSGKRYYSHEQARLQLKASENQLELVSDQLSIQEKQVRFNLKSAIDQYKAQQENISIARRVYDNVYLKYQQGVASGLDMTTANSNMLQAENAHVMSIMQVLEAQTELSKLMNQLPK